MRVAWQVVKGIDAVGDERARAIAFCDGLRALHDALKFLHVKGGNHWLKVYRSILNTVGATLMRNMMVSF